MEKYFNRLDDRAWLRINGPYGQLVIDANKAYIHSNKYFNKEIELFRGLREIGRDDVIELIKDEPILVI
jgi:hypothetical protein